MVDVLRCGRLVRPSQPSPLAERSDAIVYSALCMQLQLLANQVQGQLISMYNIMLPTPTSVPFVGPDSVSSCHYSGSPCTYIVAKTMQGNNFYFPIDL